MDETLTNAEAAPLTPAAHAPLALERPRTQSDLRKVAFANRVLEVVSVAQAYRDTYRPGQDVTTYDYVKGSELLKDADVGPFVGKLAEKALAEAGIDRMHAMIRLKETIEADLTDYVHTADDPEKKIRRGDFMDLADVRDKLPHEKRRLIKKVSKEGRIELESKQHALELLARIQSMLPSPSVTVNNNTANVFQTMSKEDLVAEIARKMSNPDVARALEAKLLPREA